jgi:predicted ATPase
VPRQQTLRALVDWSYDLLAEQEKVVLGRFSVFAGGWTLEAAEAVCAGGVIAAYEVLDLLSQLVDKSLVGGRGDDGHGRSAEQGALSPAGDGPPVRGREAGGSR